MFSVVSKGPSAFIFRLKQSRKSGLPEPEGNDNTILEISVTTATSSTTQWHIPEDLVVEDTVVEIQSV